VRRQTKNSFECGDFLTYVPPVSTSNSLPRVHVPRSFGKVKSTLDRFSANLKDGGVFVVRLFASSGNSLDAKDKHRPAAMLNIMETEFDVLEKRRYESPGTPR